MKDSLTPDQQTEGKKVAELARLQHSVGSLTDAVRTRLNDEFNVVDGRDTGSITLGFRLQRNIVFLPQDARDILADDGMLSALRVTVVNTPNSPAREFSGAVFDHRYIVPDPSRKGAFYDRRLVGEGVARIGFDPSVNVGVAPEDAFVFVLTDAMGAAGEDMAVLAYEVEALTRAHQQLGRLPVALGLGDPTSQDDSILTSTVRAHLGLPEA